MKQIALATALSLLPLSAMAAPTTQMTCAQAQQTVVRAGGIVLYTGAYTYDRYVANRSFCSPTQVTKQAFAPTRDTAACPIGSTCVEPDHEFGNGRDRF